MTFSKINIRLNRQWTAILLSLFLTCLFIGTALNPPRLVDVVLERFSYMLYDLRLNFLTLTHPIPKNPIVIVDIDEKSLQKEGRWPWSREKLTQLIENLYQQGVTVIAFDMLFPEPEPGKDTAFAETLSKNKNTAVLGIYFSHQNQPPIGELPQSPIAFNPIAFQHFDFPMMESYTGNIAQLQNAAVHAGAISVIPDKDGTIRHYNLIQRYQNHFYPALALEAARLYLLENQLSFDVVPVGNKTVIDAIKLGQTAIHTDDEGRVLIPFLGPSKTFSYYSATDIMHHLIPAHQLQNALVFLGTSAVGLSDIRSTPVESVFPGVEIHANAAEALINNQFPYVPQWIPGAQFVLLLLLGSILSWIFPRAGPLWIIFTSSVLIISIFFLSVWLWKTTHIVFPIIFSIFLVGILAIFNITYGFFIESRRRGELKKIFEQYVPAEHVEEILKNPHAFDMFEGERKIMSVLFMDIRGFTTISEKMSIVELKKLLNFFLTEMTGVIFHHGGTIDKYVGDMIMAFWGAPLNDAEHAKHAVLAGMDMVSTTKALEKKLFEMQLPKVNIGVGVNTGIMDAGDMGSTYRRAYTVLGDAVNLASRLESLTKYYGVAMICGENTVAAITPLDEISQCSLVFRRLDKVKVKGKLTGVRIYEPLGERKEMDNDQIKTLVYYEKALELYLSKQFEQAQLLFRELSEHFPETKLYQIYLERIAFFMENPPLNEWDGIWEHHEK